MRLRFMVYISFLCVSFSVYAKSVPNVITFYMQNQCPATIHLAISNYNANTSFSFFDSRVFPNNKNMLVGATQHPSFGITSFYGHVGMAPNADNTFLVYCPGNWMTCTIMSAGILVDGESYLISIVPPTFVPQPYGTVDILINQL